MSKRFLTGASFAGNITVTGTTFLDGLVTIDHNLNIQNNGVLKIAGTEVISATRAINAASATFAGQITTTKNQITTDIGTTSAIRLKPAATTNSGGKSSIFLGTSTADNYGISLRGARNSGSGAPTFELATHNNSNNGTVALSIDNSQNAAFAGHLNLLDNKELKIGTDVDLKIYHSSGNSFIQNFTGSLVIEQASGAIALRPKTGENGILIIENGAVELYHDNSKKFETTSTGVTVTGVTSTSELLWGDSFSYGKLSWDTGYALIQGQSGKGIKLQPNAGTALTLDTSLNAIFAGNVGIGVTSPNRLLHIDNTSNATKASGYFYTNAQHTGVDTQAHVSIYSDHASSTGDVLHVRGDGTGNLLTLNKGGTDKLVVDDDGNATFAGDLEVAGGTQIDGNLGVGTAPTTRQLSVFRSTAGSIANFLHYTNNTTFQGLYIQVSQSTNDVIFQSSGSGAGGFKFYAGNAEKAGIDANGNATFSGTISSKDISIKQADDSGFNGGLTIERSANTQKVHIGMDGGAVNFNSPGGLSYKFRNNGTEKFIVDGSGNATFAGAVKAYGNSDTTPAFEIYSDSNHGMRILHRSTDGDFSFERRLNGTNTEFLRVGRANGNATFAGDVSLGDSKQLKLGNSADLLIFHDGTNSYIKDTGTGNLFIQASNSLNLRSASGEWYMDGIANGPVNLYYDNVKKFETTSTGITVTGSATASSFIKSGGTSSQYLMADGSVSTSTSPFDGGTITNNLTISNSSPALNLTDTDNSSNIAFSSVGGALIVNSASDQVYQISGAEKMRIDSSGNVMMGKNSQSSNAALTVKSMAGGNTGIILVEGDTTNDGHGLYATTDNKFVITRYTNGSFSDNFVMDSSGNVGIGTTSPSTNLHINAVNSEPTLTISRDGNNMVSGQGVGSIVFPADFNGTPTNYGKIVTYANALSSLRGSIDFKVKSTSGNLLTGLTVYGTSSGVNVGIGTASPDGDLEVIASTTVSGASDSVNNVLIGLQAANRPTIILDTADTTYTNRTWNITNVGSAGSLFFGRNGLDVLVMKNDGKVGIGTTSPAAPLQVVATGIGSNGTIGIQGSNAHVGFKNSSGTFRSWVGHFNAAGHGSDADLNLKTGYGSVGNIRFTADGDTTAAQMFLQGSTGNVGIGTASPEEKLDVSGSIIIDNNEFYKVEKTDGTNYKIAGLTSGNVIQIGAIDYTSAGTIFAGGDNISITTGGASGSVRMKIDSSGNVGIGTTSPVAKFEVTDGSSSITLQEYSNGAAIFLDGVNGDFIGGDYYHIFADGSSYLGLGGYGGGTTPLNIDGSGRVLIGRTSSVTGQALQVNGFIDITNVSSSALRWFDGSTFRGGLGLDSWATGGSASNITMFCNGEFGVVTGGGNTKKLVMDTSGNVGIGIQTPTLVAGKIVHIHGVAAGIHLTDTASGTANTDGGYVAFDNPHLFIQNKEAGDIRFETSATTRLTIDSSGKVGIGTASPGAKLDVNGELYARSIIQAYAGAGNPIGGISWTSTDSGFLFAKTGNVTKVLLNSNGNSYLNGGSLGIGTTAPSSDLHILGISNDTVSQANANLNVEGQGGNGIVVGTIASSPFSTYIQSGFVDNFSTAVYPISLNPSGGNVGIGTTSPSKKLHVYNTAAADVALFESTQVFSTLAFKSSTNSSTVTIGIDGAGNAAFENKLSSGNMTFVTNGSERMRIDSSGKVGIGTTTPAAGSQLTLRSSASTGMTILSASNTGECFINFSDNDDPNIGQIFYGHSPDRMAFRVGDDTRITILGSNGNVGIGITTPQAPLSFANSVGSKIDFYHTTSGGGDRYGIEVQSSELRIHSGAQGASTGGITFGKKTTGTFTEAMRIRNDGNVGIGTTTPGDKLNIHNSSANANVGIKITRGSQTHGLRLGVNDSHAFLWTDQNQDLAFATNNTQRMVITNTGNVLVNGPAVGTTQADGDYIAKLYTSSADGFLELFTGEGTPISRVKISSFGNSYFAGAGTGRVGIGTTSPAAKLEVYGNVQNDTTSIANSAAYIRGADVGVAIGQSASSPYGTWIQSQRSSDGVTFPLALNPSGSNVGIGTTSPANKLFVTSNTAGDYTGFIENTNSTNGYGLLSRTANTGTSSYAFAARAGSSDVFVVRADGNVGIGTTSPNHKLDIQVDSNVALRLHRFNSALDTTEPIGIGFSHRGDTANSTTDTRAGIFSSYNGDLFFSVDQGGRVDDDPIADAAMFIDGAAGNVGIGTTSPAQPLSVHGNFLVRTTSANGNKNRMQCIVGGSSDAANLYLYHGNSGDGTVSVRINAQGDSYFNGGNVGIGTSSPSTSLSVQGTTNNGINVIGVGTTAVRCFVGLNSSNHGYLFAAGSSGQSPSLINSAGGDSYISGGNVGIGNTSPSQKLHVTGSILASSDVVAFSDKKLKENIKTLDGSKVYNMRGVSFTRKDTGKDSSGVIAQEIQKIAPELVTDNDGTLSVAYGNLTGYLIEAVKELKAEIEELKKHKCDCKK